MITTNRSARTSRTLWLEKTVPEVRRPETARRQVSGYASLMPVYVGAAACIALSGMVVGFAFAMLVLTGLGFLGMGVGLRYPSFGALGVSLLCTLDVISRLFAFSIGILPWNTFNYWLVMIIFLNAGLFVKMNYPPVRVLQVFVAVQAAWLLFTPPAGMEAGVSIVLSVLSCFGIILTLWHIGNDGRTWYYVALTAGTVGATVGLVYYAQQGALPYINHNAWAYVPLTGMIGVCFGHRFAPQRGPGRLLLGLLVILNFLWVFLSTSRGTILVAGICLLFYLFTLKGTGQRLLLGGLFLLVGSVVLSRYGGLEQEAMHRIQNLFSDERELSDRTSGRSELALGAWYMFKENPLGVGTGAFAQEWKALGYEQTGSQWGQRRAAHSGWLATLAENGVAGFVVLVVFAISFVFSGMLRIRHGLLPYGVFVTLVFSIALLTTEFSSKGLWFLVAAGTVLLHRWYPPAPAGTPATPEAAPAGRKKN